MEPVDKKGWGIEQFDKWRLEYRRRKLEPEKPDIALPEILTLPKPISDQYKDLKKIFQPGR